MRLLRTSNIVGRRFRMMSGPGDGDFVSAMLEVRRGARKEVK